jgi:hypothetical protein
MTDQAFAQRVLAMRDEMASILDSNITNGELRVKLAKAELVLNKIARLVEEDLKTENSTRSNDE